MIHDKCVDGDGRLPHDFEACRSAEVTCDLEQNITFIRRSKVRDRIIFYFIYINDDFRKVNYKTGNVKQQISSVVRSRLQIYR